MKIKLVSIDGKIADPLYNEGLMEKEVSKACEEGVELLIFPSNSISGNSIADLRDNVTYENQVEYAYKKFKQFIVTFYGMRIIFDGYENTLNYKNKSFIIEDGADLLDLKYLDNIESIIKFKPSNPDEYFILCQGRGTESTSQGVYSNIKLISKFGRILASNLENDENELIFDTDDEYSKTPYLDDIKDYEKMFKNILHLQGVGLYQKMKSMNRFKICMGVSGGLDSTVSLLACVEIFKKYKLPLKNIIGVTMPGLGTTERTYNNALNLMKDLGITILDIDLRPLLKTHLENIKQPKNKFDVTYEQTQSRERTQVLLDLANKENAIMIGTGCMSEFALGWMTYGGDHLSMYAINIGLPKTVVKMYAKWFIEKYDGTHSGKTTENWVKIAEIVQDVLDGPVSPELLPIDEKGEQHEKTESLIGDYEVQDFFIYYMTFENNSIKELFNKACKAFPKYSHENILKWLEIFTLRYFTRAYKKNCYGDGLQLFDYSVSPWFKHIPSDIDNTIWQQEIEELKKEISSSTGSR